MHRDTCGVDLSECKVGKVGTLLKCLNCGRTVAAHSICGKEESTSVTAGGEHYGMSGVTLQLACDEVAHDDTAGTAVDDYEIKHLATVE